MRGTQRPGDDSLSELSRFHHTLPMRAMHYAISIVSLKPLYPYPVAVGSVLFPFAIRPNALQRPNESLCSVPMTEEQCLLCVKPRRLSANRSATAWVPGGLGPDRTLGGGFPEGIPKAPPHRRSATVSATVSAIGPPPVRHPVRHSCPPLVRVPRGVAHTLSHGACIERRQPGGSHFDAAPPTRVGLIGEGSEIDRSFRTPR
jgi:hypothetical protein